MDRPVPRLSDILKAHVPDCLARYRSRLSPQVTSALAKLSLCRTRALGGHLYRCSSCASELPMYNSCRDRHCPQCAGGRRADWLSKSAELILPGLSYFQVVFTLPSELRSLALGNRRAIFQLLMQASWKALDERLRAEQGIQPAALLVLHTWNQELDVHPHVHALVPGGGPTIDGGAWRTTAHPRQIRRAKPFLCDVEALSRSFQEHFLAGLARLRKDGALRLSFAEFRDDGDRFAAWLRSLTDSPWCVYAQGPPRGDSSPAEVLKYLARYMSGGPISDRRLIAHENGQVTFWARSRDRRNQSRPFQLGVEQFIYRWTQHILPSGFVRSRAYGGYHNRRRSEYLALCRDMIVTLVRKDTSTNTSSAVSPSITVEALAEAAEQRESDCPHCGQSLIRMFTWERPSWRDVLSGRQRPSWYAPFLNGHGRAYVAYRGGD